MKHRKRLNNPTRWHPLDRLRFLLLWNRCQLVPDGLLHEAFEDMPAGDDDAAFVNTEARTDNLIRRLARGTWDVEHRCDRHRCLLDSCKRCACPGWRL